MLTSGEGHNRRRDAVRTAINVALILDLSLFIGRFIPHAFGLDLADLRIAGGLIVGWQMVNSSGRKQQTANPAGRLDSATVTL